MKKTWLVFAVVCVVLLLAWPFRWEKGPVLTHESEKVFHTKDRWTGQRWATTYFLRGNVVENLYLESWVVAKRTEQVKQKYAQGHTEYLRMWKKLSAEFERQNPIPTLETIKPEPTEQMRREIHYVPIPGWKSVEDIVTEQMRLEIHGKRMSQWLETRDNYISSKMPADLAEACSNWRRAESTAERELTRKAYFIRNLATGIWSMLLVAMGLWAWRVYIKKDQKE
ncbi:MAG TPA: hypothetical protein DD719_06030 [Desulfotomaculum sp.]|nr:hypothetical protein [Desulfotomaculum sp.]